MTALQQQSVDIIHKYWDIGNSIYGLSLPYPIISFRLTGRTAGKANTGTQTILLNAQLLEENGQTFLDRTPAHEVAHIFAFKSFGIQRTMRGRRQVHGTAWKRVMRDFGLNATRCHSYDTSNSRQTRRQTNRPYIYACECQEFHFTGIRHRRSMNGSVYRCTTCRKPVAFVRLAA